MILIANPVFEEGYFTPDMAQQNIDLLERICKPKNPVVTTGLLWTRFEAECGRNFGRWAPWLFNEQRPTDRIRAVLVMQPWLGKATVDLLRCARDQYKLPISLFTHPELQIAQPPGSAPWWDLMPEEDRDRVDPRGLAGKLSLAEPPTECGCKRCKVTPQHPRAVQPLGQRPWRASQGGWALCLSDEHARRIVAWQPPEPEAAAAAAPKVGPATDELGAVGGMDLGLGDDLGAVLL